MTAKAVMALPPFLERDLRLPRMLAPCLNSHSESCLVSSSLDQVYRICLDENCSRLVQQRSSIVSRTQSSNLVARIQRLGKYSSSRTRNNSTPRGAGGADVLLLDSFLSPSSVASVDRSSTDSINSVASLPETSLFQNSTTYHNNNNTSNSDSNDRHHNTQSSNKPLVKQFTQKLSDHFIPPLKSNNRSKQQNCQTQQNDSQTEQNIGHKNDLKTVLTKDLFPEHQLTTHQSLKKLSNDQTIVHGSLELPSFPKTHHEELLEAHNVDENNNTNISESQKSAQSINNSAVLTNQLNEFEAKLKLLEDPIEEEGYQSRRDSIKSCLRSPSNDGSPKRRLSVKFADESGFHLTKTLSFENFDHLFSIEVPHQNAPKLFSPIKKMRRFIPQFQLSSNSANLAQKVAHQKVTLESVHIFGTMVSGSVLVESLNHPKKVLIRFTLDNWKTWKEFSAVAASGQNDSYDRFEFEHYFEPAEIEQTVEFCIKYENSFGEYWDNNSNMNYSMKLD